MAPLGKLLTQSNTMHHLYADDVLIYFVYEETPGCAELYQKVLDDVAEWMTSNYLAINPDKTQCLLLHGRRCHLPNLPQLNIMGDHLTIHTDGAMKYLGVNIDAHLDLSEHVVSTCKAAFFQLRTIRRARPFLNRNNTINLCNSLVLSRVDYCCPILHGVTSKNMDRLQRVINAAARVVYCSKRTCHTSNLISDLKWLNMRQRCTFRTACLLYKALNGLAPPYLTIELEQYHPNRTLRSDTKNLLVLKTNKKAVGKHIIKVMAPSVWNQLPQDLRDERRLSSFCDGLRNVLCELTSEL
jgi:hypothetical protein